VFDLLSRSFSSVFKKITGNDRLSEKNIKQVYEQVTDALLEADVPYDVVQRFMTELQARIMGQKVLSSLKPQEQFVKTVHETLTQFLGGEAPDKQYKFVMPTRIVMMGLQGSGKTTTIAKLVRYIRKYQGHKIKIMVASVDFYRPAAVDQLEQLARQQEVVFYRANSKQSVDAVSEIKKAAKGQCCDVLIVDTAGRLHVDEELLRELKDIISIIAPAQRLLVLDAMTGQESIVVAQAFEQAVGIDGAILTKLDSDTRGGSAFAFRYVLKKPILFVSSGEKAEDFEQFRPERIAERMLGMGDLLTLAERAQEKIEQSEQDRFEHAMKTGNITLEDFLAQLSMMNRLGSLTSVARFIPGMSAANIGQDQIIQAEQEMKKFKAIIQSMTLKERSKPAVLDHSRKKRIARGAGVQPADITALLSRFEQLQQFVKLFKRFGKFPGL